MMFEIGKHYEVEISEQPGERIYVHGEALAYEGTLLKLLIDKRERIFNTAAFSFVGAREWRLPTASIYQPGKAPQL